MRRKDREITDRSEIQNILDSCKTASVAMNGYMAPYVVPLSYGYEWEGSNLILYFHCAKEGKKLELLKENSMVCFTVFREGEPVHGETPCNSGYYYSSIIGYGIARFLYEPDEKKHALQKLYAHQTGRIVEFTKEQADSVCVFKIISENYTGKQKRRP